jgi:hypothetical protein
MTDVLKRKVEELQEEDAKCQAALDTAKKRARDTKRKLEAALQVLWAAELEESKTRFYSTIDQSVKSRLANDRVRHLEHRGVLVVTDPSFLRDPIPVAWARAQMVRMSVSTGSGDIFAFGNQKVGNIWTEPPLNPECICVWDLSDPTNSANV